MLSLCAEVARALPAADVSVPLAPSFVQSNHLDAAGAARPSSWPQVGGGYWSWWVGAGGLLVLMAGGCWS